MAEIGMADDELRMLTLAYRDVERDPNALNVKLEDFFHRFDDTVRRVLRFLQFPEEHIPAMAGRGPRIYLLLWFYILIHVFQNPPTTHHLFHGITIPVHTTVAATTFIISLFKA